MNIFVLDIEPSICAMLHKNKHIVKMPLETAQMLCTTLYHYGVEVPYKPVHKKHPCTLWAGESRENFEWLCQLGIELCKEYTRRYKKTHASLTVIEYCKEFSFLLPSSSLTPFAQAMPVDCKHPDPVTAYWNYYSNHKQHIK